MLRLKNSVLRKYVGSSSPCSPRRPLAESRAACTVCTASSQKKKIGNLSRPQRRVTRKIASVSAKKTRFWAGVGASAVRGASGARRAGAPLPGPSPAASASAEPERANVDVTIAPAESEQLDADRLGGSEAAVEVELELGIQCRIRELLRVRFRLRAAGRLDRGREAEARAAHLERDSLQRPRLREIDVDDRRVGTLRPRQGAGIGVEEVGGLAEVPLAVRDRGETAVDESLVGDKV